jgi:hypothetical protein
MTENKDTNLPDIWQQQRQEIIATKKVSAIHKIKHWFDIFDKLVLHDETIDKKLKIGSSVMTVCGVVFFILAIVFNWFSRSFFLWLAINIPLVLTFIGFYIRGRQLKKQNIENHFRLYTYPLLRIFEQESSPNERVKLNLDFNNPEQKPYLIQTIPNTNSSYPKIKTDFYKITWLNAEVAFTDKTQLEVTITDFIRARNVTKYNQRGTKIKTKIKRKIKQTIVVKILFDKTQYKASPKTSKTKNLVEQADGYCMKLKAYNVLKTTNTDMDYDQYTDMNPLLSVIAQAYAAVVPI